LSSESMGALQMREDERKNPPKEEKGMKTTYARRT